MKTILTLLLLVSIQAQAAEWTQADTAREVTYQVIEAMDWMQTRYLIKHPYAIQNCTDPCHEVNRILGQYPSTDRVNTYFLIVGIAHYAISKALPKNWRTGWQYVSIGFEGAVVARNFHLGIKMDFP